MKNKIAFAPLALLAVILLTAAVAVQTNNIFIQNTGNDEIKIRMRTTSAQTAPLLEFVVGSTAVFGIATNGVPYGSGFGLTTNIDVIIAGSTTNRLAFTNGILYAVTPQ